MRWFNWSVIFISCLFLTACSDSGGEHKADAKQDHVWKEQTDTINKAKEVEGMLLDSADATRKAIENQNK